MFCFLAGNGIGRREVRALVILHTFNTYIVNRIAEIISLVE